MNQAAYDRLLIDRPPRSPHIVIAGRDYTEPVATS
jgi:hypothetical protein